MFLIDFKQIKWGKKMDTILYEFMCFLISPYKINHWVYSNNLILKKCKDR